MLPLRPGLIDDGVYVEDGAASRPVLAVRVPAVGEQVSIFEESIQLEVHNLF